MSTDNLIELLVADGSSCRSFQARFRSMAACAVTFVALAFFLEVGLRHDFSQAIRSGWFLYKVFAMLALAVISTGATRCAGNPHGDIGRWMPAYAGVLISLAGAVALKLLITPQSEWFTQLVGHDAWRCMTLIPLLSIGPLACLLLALRQGAPARPSLAGALAGLGASSIAATFYAANCTDDSPLFVLTWFSVPMILLAATGYLFGRRLLDW
ncbi:MAG TPA: NrsF family protein [Acetobacteraceae bacterium]|nr:NrsF family protein [Acetobacteraceae bacterium]